MPRIKFKGPSAESVLERSVLDAKKSYWRVWQRRRGTETPTGMIKVGLEPRALLGTLKRGRGLGISPTAVVDKAGDALTLTLALAQSVSVTRSRGLPSFFLWREGRGARFGLPPHAPLSLPAQLTPHKGRGGVT